MASEGWGSPQGGVVVVVPIRLFSPRLVVQDSLNEFKFSSEISHSAAGFCKDVSEVRQDYLRAGRLSSWGAFLNVSPPLGVEVAVPAPWMCLDFLTAPTLFPHTPGVAVYAYGGAAEWAGAGMP